MGWDTVDILRMRMRGIEVRVLHDLEYHHVRRMGTRNGYVDGMLRDGRNAYLTGYSPWFLILRAVYNGVYRPYLPAHRVHAGGLFLRPCTPACPAS